MKKIRIDSSKNKIRLKDFLIKKEEEVNLELIFPPNFKIDLQDDLLTAGVLKSSITLILNENSIVNYTFDATQKISGKKDDEITKTLKISLEARGSQANVKVSCLGEGEQKYKIETIQHHKAEETRSDLTIKSVLLEKSALISNNLIRVEEGISKIFASENTKSLLLGEEARFSATPKLEVKSDDVSCKHGAAISRLDEEQLFYLQSRGMSLGESKKFLVDAFLK